MNPLNKQIAEYKNSRGLDDFPEDDKYDSSDKFIYRQFNAIFDIEETFYVDIVWDYRKESTLYQEYLIGSGLELEDLDEQYESIEDSFNLFVNDMKDTGIIIKRVLHRTI